MSGEFRADEFREFVVVSLAPGGLNRLQLLLPQHRQRQSRLRHPWPADDKAFSCPKASGCFPSRECIGSPAFDSPLRQARLQRASQQKQAPLHHLRHPAPRPESASFEFASAARHLLRGDWQRSHFRWEKPLHRSAPPAAVMAGRESEELSRYRMKCRTRLLRV